MAAGPQSTRMGMVTDKWVELVRLYDIRMPARMHTSLLVFFKGQEEDIPVLWCIENVLAGNGYLGFTKLNLKLDLGRRCLYAQLVSCG